MNIRTVLISAVCALAMMGCSNDNANIVASEGESKSPASSSQKGKVVYQVLAKKVQTKGASYCAIPMRLTNKTKREISSFRVGWFKVVTKHGVVNAYGNSIRDVKPGKFDTFSAAFGVEGTACEDIQDIIVETLTCEYSGVTVATKAEDHCRHLVVFKGTKNLNFDLDENVVRNGRRVSE